jgi:uncharacterized protein YdaU (DUF1376 family)
MMDLYYDTEKELPADFDRLCALVLARTDEERTAVQRTLNEFFIPVATGYFHSRCDHEISKYRGNNSQRAMAGKASAEARKAKKLLKIQELAKINGRSTDVEISLNEKAEPINQSTNKPEPINILAVSDKSPPAAKPVKIGFDYATGRWSGLAENKIQIDAWKAAYPAVDMLAEFAAMEAWLVSNPKNRKSNIPRFINSWLSKQQDKPRKTAPQQPAKQGFIERHTDKSWRDGL